MTAYACWCRRHRLPSVRSRPIHRAHDDRPRLSQNDRPRRLHLRADGAGFRGLVVLLVHWRLELHLVRRHRVDVLHRPPAPCASPQNPTLSAQAGLTPHAPGRLPTAARLPRTRKPTHRSRRPRPTARTRRRTGAATTRRGRRRGRSSRGSPGGRSRGRRCWGLWRRATRRCQWCRWSRRGRRGRRRGAGGGGRRACVLCVCGKSGKWGRKQGEGKRADEERMSPFAAEALPGPVPPRMRPDRGGPKSARVRPSQEARPEASQRLTELSCVNNAATSS